MPSWASLTSCSRQRETGPRSQMALGPGTLDEPLSPEAGVTVTTVPCRQHRDRLRSLSGPASLPPAATSAPQEPGAHGSSLPSVHLDGSPVPQGAPGLQPARLSGRRP